MSFHKWRRLPTKHFGEVWAPFAHIKLQGSDGTAHSLALHIDSGAVVSLLARSMADLLGIEFESGDPVALSSVGGKPTKAFVHAIETSFADRIRFPVRYAIATTESVPNLLGRLDVFDQLQVDFDPSLTQTGIVAPWLDDEQRLIYDFLNETEQYILERRKDWGFPEPAPEALGLLVNRMGQLYVGALALVKLHRTYSGPLYVRAMFEVWIQLEYLLKEPKARATRYLEFEHVTKYKQALALAENPSGPISTAVATSPMRKEGEVRNKTEYERVRPLFEHETKAGKIRESAFWFGTNLAELAETLGYGGEYRVVYKSCSAWAHANPFRGGTVEGDPFAKPDAVFTFCTAYYARMLRSIADAAKMVLPSKYFEFLDEASIKIH